MLEKFDLVILRAVMLPGIDGFEVLRRLRASSKVPFLMLTARGDDVDRIVGLELGADDYLPKPFNPRELAARVRAILRRMEPRTEAAAKPIEVRGVLLDPATRSVSSRGKCIELTTIEFDILELLLRSAGRVLTRDAIMEALYSRKATPFDRAIDMHISHLRKKLESGILSAGAGAPALWEGLQGEWAAAGRGRVRLYAFGYDAYQLLRGLEVASRGTAVDGLTGRLTLDPGGRVQRETDWAQVQGGRLQPAGAMLLLPPPGDP